MLQNGDANNNVQTEMASDGRPEQIFQFMQFFLWDIIHYSFHPMWHYIIPDIRSNNFIGHQTKQPIEAIF
jgi:hypothetical protein